MPRKKRASKYFHCDASDDDGSNESRESDIMGNDVDQDFIDDANDDDDTARFVVETVFIYTGRMDRRPRFEYLRERTHVGAMPFATPVVNTVSSAEALHNVPFPSPLGNVEHGAGVGGGGAGAAGAAIPAMANMTWVTSSNAKKRKQPASSGGAGGGGGSGGGGGDGALGGGPVPSAGGCGEARTAPKGRPKTAAKKKKGQDQAAEPKGFTATISVRGGNVRDEDVELLTRWTQEQDWAVLGVESRATMGRTHMHLVAITDEVKTPTAFHHFVERILHWDAAHADNRPKNANIMAHAITGIGFYTPVGQAGYALKEHGDPNFRFALGKNVTDDDLIRAREELIKHGKGALKDRIPLCLERTLLPRVAEYYSQHYRHKLADEAIRDKFTYRDVAREMVRETQAFYFSNHAAYENGRLNEDAANAVFKSMVKPGEFSGFDADAILFRPLPLGDPDQILYRRGKTLLVRIAADISAVGSMPHFVDARILPNADTFVDFREDNTDQWPILASTITENKVTFRSGQGRTVRYFDRANPSDCHIRPLGIASSTSGREVGNHRVDRDEFAANDDFVPVSGRSLDDVEMVPGETLNDKLFTARAQAGEVDNRKFWNPALENLHEDRD